MTTYGPYQYAFRDLTAKQRRAVIGQTVTARIFDNAEASEPTAVVTGVIKLVGETADGTVIMIFDGTQSNNAQPISADEPIQIELDIDLQLIA